MSASVGVTPVEHRSEGLKASWRRTLVFGEQHGWALFATTLVWLPATIAASRVLRLWFDELITFYISQLHSAASISDALRHGVDLQPPFFFWVTRIFAGGIGYTELGIRAPAIFFFGVFTLTVFQVVRRTMGAWYAWMAVWLALCTPAYAYSHEARPYAMLLAFASLSLLFWLRYIESAQISTLIGLTASIAGTVSSHYYGVFAILPLFAGEAVRSYQRRRWDVRALLAIVLGFTPLLFFLPTARAGAALRSHMPWNPVNLASAGKIYNELFWSLSVPLIVVLVVQLAWRRAREEVSQTEMPPFSPALIATATYILVPILATIAAGFGSNMMSSRYLLPAVIGVVVAITQCLYKAVGGAKAPAAIVAVLCATWFLYTNRDYYRVLAKPSPGELSLPIPPSDLPVMISSAHDYVAYFHYSGALLKPRLFYVADPAIAARRVGTPSAAVNMIEAAPFFSFQVIDFNRLRQYSDFLLYDNPQSTGKRWLLAELADDGANIQVYARDGDAYVYRVRFPPVF